ncbi:MAG: TolC family protein [Flavipsychrobacter sp.]
MPEASEYKVKLTGVTDTTFLQQHPLLQFAAQQQRIANAAVRLEQSRLLPDLLVGYNNTSMKGLNADDKFYNGDTRFSSVQFGIGIPIFYSAQKNRINSAKLNAEIAQNSYGIAEQQIVASYQTAILAYNRALQAVQYFEGKALANANTIVQTANEQLAAGAINYLEWVQLMNQATVVNSNYIDAVKELNTAIIQLNYFIVNK